MRRWYFLNWRVLTDFSRSSILDLFSAIFLMLFCSSTWYLVSWVERAPICVWTAICILDTRTSLAELIVDVRSCAMELGWGWRVVHVSSEEQVLSRVDSTLFSRSSSLFVLFLSSPLFLFLFLSTFSSLYLFHYHFLFSKVNTFFTVLNLCWLHFFNFASIGISA